MIGVFDSGLGGLSTLKEIFRLLPEYDTVYLGDSARAPYGNRSAETVCEYTEEGVDFLFSKGAKMVLVACNTASADALRHLQKKYGNEKKVLGVLVPAVEKALEKSRFGRIGMVGTTGTVKAKNFEKEILKRTELFYHPKDRRARKIPQFFAAACPLLVPLVEEGWEKKPETTMILKKYLIPLKSANLDTLILGCTHYPMLEKIFAKKMGKSCIIINSAAAQAEKLVEYLQNHPEIETQLSKTKTHHFFTSDDPEKFQTLGSRFLGKTIAKVEKISW